VHDVGDVLGGIGVGLLSLVIFIFVTSKRFEWWRKRHPLWQIGAIAVIEVFFFLTWPGKLSPSVTGYGALLMGFWIGVIIEREWIFFQKHPDWWRLIASGVIGVILFVALQKGFEAVSGMVQNGKTTVALIQAFFSGVYVTALAPWIFQHFRFAEKRKPANE
jgi:hypothetical protein